MPTTTRRAPVSKVTRISSGIYDIVINGVVYELERYPDGSWLTFYRPEGDHTREYLNDYATKRAAIADLVSNCAGPDCLGS